MTASDLALSSCPRCGHGPPLPLSNKTLLCAECRLEWDPEHPPDDSLWHVADPLEALSDELRPADTGAVDEEMVADLSTFIADIDAETDALVTDLATLVGTDVILNSGQRATITGFPDDDHMAVRFADGSTFDVSFEDVRGSADAPSDDEQEPPAIPDEQQIEIGKTALMVAGFVLKAGLASVVGGDGNERIVEPPTGWLPPDADTIPVLEMGAAYAVATLMHAFTLPRDQVETFAETLMHEAQQSEPEGDTE